MKNYNDFLNKRNTAFNDKNRLRLFIEEYKKYKDKKNKKIKILDIGCGKDAVLADFIDNGDTYVGCDYYKKINKKIARYVSIDLNSDKLDKRFKDQKFDVVFCGEVIEHLFSPDDLLDEIKKIMHKDSILILSTPNLGYYVNRALLLFGIHPLFIENSSEKKLGRKFKFLGQENIAEGHIRVFTHDALKDLLKMKKFKIVSITPISVWNFWPDKIVNKISKSLAADNIFVLKI